uniref:Triple QxxK/R motif-containing protein n=1 Tax=Trichuris muris TaxID=70415 RepID=A0A5S6QXZ1_TRIMR
MTRRNATHGPTMPIEQYRRKIGQADSKTTHRREQTLTKRKEKVEENKTRSYSFLCRLLIVLIASLSLLYIAMYLCLTYDADWTKQKMAMMMKWMKISHNDL